MKFEKKNFFFILFFCFSETSIRLARENLAASRKPSYLPNDVTLAELFKYEQSLAKDAAKNKRHIYSTTES